MLHRVNCDTLVVQGRVRHDTRMKPLSEVMGRVLGDVAKRTSSAGALRPLWNQAVGELVAKHSEPVRLDGRVLVVRCDAPAWREALVAEQSSILSRLQAALGESSVTQLVFEVA